MEFYDEKDLEYWKKQAEKGKAVILEIPVSMLLDLDLSSLPQDHPGKISAEDVEKWMAENREEIEEALKTEQAEKEELARLEQMLYETGRGEDGAGEYSPVSTSVLPLHDAKQAVARIMAEESFSEEQIAVIAQAMVEELPDRYLLCFLKKEYSPEVMRKVKNYCTKMYREEVGME